ncbi:hypothetical protein ABZP36_012049 [Zizania latifolia]
MVSFKANRSDPELVVPALPTPRETKTLSDVDTQPALRFYATGVEFFSRRPTIDGDDDHAQPEDAAKAVKAALAKALVYFYPVAGLQHLVPSKTLTLPTPWPLTDHDMVGEYFFFGPREIASLRSHARLHHGSSSSTVFELITAAMWKCRTVALGHAPDQRASLLITMNARGRWKCDPPLPQGFYGNGFVYLVVETMASELCSSSSLGHAVELVQKAKLDMTEEFTKSMVDLIALHGGPPYVPGWTFVVSDITRIGVDALDFGWAQRVGGGVPMVGDVKSKQVSYQMRCANVNGEDCVVASMFLPEPAMDTFAKEIFALSSEIDK